MKLNRVTILFSLLLISLPININKVSAEDYSKFEDLETQYNNSLNNLDETILKSTGEISRLEIELSNLQEERMYINKRYDLVVNRIDDKKSLIVSENEKLGELRREMYSTSQLLEDRDGLFKSRVNSMYKSDYKISLFDLILKSDGFSDLLIKMNTYKKISNLDNDVINDYVELMDQMKKKESLTEDLLESINLLIIDLEKMFVNLDELSESKKTVETDLEKKLNEIEEKLLNLNSKRSDTKSKLEDVIREKELLRLEILNREKLAKELEEKENSVVFQVTDETKKEEDVVVNSSKDSNSNVSKPDISKPNANANVTKPIKNNPNVDESISNIVRRISSKYEIPYEMVMGVIQGESNFNVNAVYVNTNGTTDRGIIQLNSNTAPYLAKRLGIPYSIGIEFVPEIAIEMGVLYLSDHYKESNGDIDRTLSSYNRGPTGATNYFKKHGTYETSYSKKIKGYMLSY